ncbi:MAG: peroxiredoxin [Sphingomonadales bacterium]|nr:peroxiredoxin [Sphingomonadales bacterium]
MAIKVGDKLPEATFMTMSADGPKPMTTAEVFGGKKVALFAVPGAYTPTCHKQHMPGFVDRAEELKKKGFDAVACTAVNDVFVLTNWSKDSQADGKIQMLADGSADFAKKIGLEIDLTARGLGVRSKRYAMAVEDGVVKILNIEDAPPDRRQVQRGHPLLHGGQEPLRRSAPRLCRRRLALPAVVFSVSSRASAGRCVR